MSKYSTVTTGGSLCFRPTGGDTLGEDLARLGGFSSSAERLNAITDGLSPVRGGSPNKASSNRSAGTPNRNVAGNVNPDEQEAETTFHVDKMAERVASRLNQPKPPAGSPGGGYNNYAVNYAGNYAGSTTAAAGTSTGYINTTTAATAAATMNSSVVSSQLQNVSKGEMLKKQRSVTINEGQVEDDGRDDGRNDGRGQRQQQQNFDAEINEALEGLEKQAASNASNRSNRSNNTMHLSPDSRRANAVRRVSDGGFAQDLLRRVEAELEAEQHQTTFV